MVTCSMDESDDFFNAEEPNDESYHDNTIEDQINLEKTEIRKIVCWTVGNETENDIAEENEFEWH